jgi:hypothetical protein
MFFRTKTSGPRSYLQIVENRWEDGRPRQRGMATIRDKMGHCLHEFFTMTPRAGSPSP